jgi:transcriptional regulator with XRE-family HTH domain
MKINQIRKARGISQAEIAEMVGVTQATISKLENLDPGCTIGKYVEYAAALGVPLYELFADDRSLGESALISAFRRLPAERQAGWLDMARLAKDDRL